MNWSKFYGGPGDDTMSIPLILVKAITNMKYGYANASAVMMILIGVAILFIVQKSFIFTWIKNRKAVFSGTVQDKRYFMGPAMDHIVEGKFVVVGIVRMIYSFYFSSARSFYIVRRLDGEVLGRSLRNVLTF